MLTRLLATERGARPCHEHRYEERCAAVSTGLDPSGNALGAPLSGAGGDADDA